MKRTNNIGVRDMMRTDLEKQWNDGTALLYIYRMASDTGLAPCVQDGLLTFSCCKGGQVRNDQDVKTGIRYWVGEKIKTNGENDTIFLMGTYKDRLLYLARITNVMTMAEYYSGKSKDRLDDIYKCKDGDAEKLEYIKTMKDSKGNWVHSDENQQRRDKAGKYVLMSDDYIYLGRESDKMEEIHELIEYGPKRQETKKYEGEEAKIIIKACMVYKDRQDGSPHDELKRNGGCR